MENLPTFPCFEYETDKANAGPRWEKWLNRLENLFVGVNITNEGRQRALLLHYAGESVHDIYDAEKSSHAADTASTYEGTKTILNNYFMPKINVQMEIYTFRKCHQRDDQSLDEYATELRQLARNCNFNDVDGEMLSQIIQHCRSNRLRRRALRENDKSLSDIQTLGRSLELSDRQANTIESEQNATYNVTNSMLSRAIMGHC